LAVAFLLSSASSFEWSNVCRLELVVGTTMLKGKSYALGYGRIDTNQSASTTRRRPSIAVLSADYFRTEFRGQ